MNIITISREFGSGGRELGKRLADKLNYDYYDSEIISAVAKNSNMNENYVEDVLSNHGWKNQIITFRGTLTSTAYIQNSKVALLLEQKKVIENIAKLNKDFIIVGRNADVILQEYKPFNIFVCASKEAKLKRCKERAKESENLTDKELLNKMKQIDKIRKQTRELLSNSPWGERESYHLIINTSDFIVKELVPIIADYASCYFGKEK